MGLLTQGHPLDWEETKKYAHLFVRDTVTVFEEKLQLDDTQDTDHF
ncbi:unnamed protein product, partial [Rotaria sordida]